MIGNGDVHFLSTKIVIHLQKKAIFSASLGWSFSSGVHNLLKIKRNYTLSKEWHGLCSMFIAFAASVKKQRHFR